MAEKKETQGDIIYAALPDSRHQMLWRRRLVYLQAIPENAIPLLYTINSQK